MRTSLCRDISQGGRAEDLAPGFTGGTFRITEELFELGSACALRSFGNIIGNAIGRTSDLIFEAPIAAICELAIDLDTQLVGAPPDI